MSLYYSDESVTPGQAVARGSQPALDFGEGA